MEDISTILKRKKTFSHIYRFLARIYHAKKTEELFSFIIWELKYRLSLYPKKNILNFIEFRPISLINDSNFKDVVTSKFMITQCDSNWSFIHFDSAKNLWGCSYDDESLLQVKSPDDELIATFRFDNIIKGLFIDSSDNVFCCSNGNLFRSKNLENFIKVLSFSTCDSYFRKDGFTETADNVLFIGEYANILEGNKWKFVGHIHYSYDNGENWEKTDFLKKLGVNKHIHIIKWSNLIGGLVMTDGDNQKNIWINKSKNYTHKLVTDSMQGWKKVNRRHINKGGYMSIAEAGDKIFLGTDYNGGTNFLVSTSDLSAFHTMVVPNPHRRAIFERIVLRDNGTTTPELWTSLIFKHSKKVKNLLMFSQDYGKTWAKAMVYDGTQYELQIVSMSQRIEKEIFFLFKRRGKPGSKSFKIS